MEVKLFLTIIHLFGVALGAGGAYMSDLIFLSSVRDNHISRTEMRFMELGSRMVWVGLLVLILSGLGIFLTAPDIYLSSSKFLAKMTIVGVIFINGLVFHLFHLPRVRRHVGEHFPSSDEFMRRRPILLASGAVSFVSWSSALILGAWSGLSVGYLNIMLVYLAVVFLAVIFSLIVFRKVE